MFAARRRARGEGRARLAAGDRRAPQRSTSGSRPRTCRCPRTGSRVGPRGPARARRDEQRRGAQARSATSWTRCSGSSAWTPITSFGPQHLPAQGDADGGNAHQAGTCGSGRTRRRPPSTSTAGPTSWTTSTSSTPASSFDRGRQSGADHHRQLAARGRPPARPARLRPAAQPDGRGRCRPTICSRASGSWWCSPWPRSCLPGAPAFRRSSCSSPSGSSPGSPPTTSIRTCCWATSTSRSCRSRWA